MSKQDGRFEKGQSSWNAGKPKQQDPHEIRKCKVCGELKIVTEFTKGKGHLYRYNCKACRAKSRRTGRPNTGRFKPGHEQGKRFEVGSIPWYKQKGLPHPCKEKFDETNENRFSSWKYKQWRKQVISRDGGKCVNCQSTKMLSVHHLESWETCVEKRFDVENGLTLCGSCHAREEGLGVVIRP